MLYALAAVLFALAAFDSWLTQARIKHYGIQVELNASIRKLVQLVGPELGSIFGVMIPTSGLVGLGLMLHLQWVLAILVGFRLRQFFVQIESLVFEKQIKAFKEELNKFGAFTDPSRSAREQSLELKQSPKSTSEGNE